MSDDVRRPSRSEHRVWQLSALMALAAAALAVPGLLGDPAAAVPTPAWAALVALFAIAEVVVIHVPTGRSSHSQVLREIPAVIGLVFLAPQQYVSALVLGATLALVLWSRVRGLKLAFNVAMLALEAALGSLVFHAVLDGAAPTSPRTWVAAAAAVLVTDLLSAAAVTAAISLTDSRLDPAALREAVRTGIPAAMVNTCVALLLVTLIAASPTALPLLGVLAALLAAGYRVHVGLARGYSRLQQLYQFVGSTSHEAELDPVVASVLAEAARLTRATRAQLVLLPEADQAARCVTWLGGDVTSRDLGRDLSGRWWSSALEGESVLLARGTGTRRPGTTVAGPAPRDGMAVPMSPDGTVAGVLVVTDRTFAQETFGPEDLRVFETVVAHAAVALDKARVVDRLRRLAEERAHEARHDPLTGLLNRRAFQQAVQDAVADGASAAVLLLDLDDFKDVNDTLGHSAGDRLLTVTAQRLADSGAGLVARLGGDEFAVLLPGADATEAAVHAARVHARVGSPVPLLGVELTTSVSIGVTAVAGGSLSAEEILAQADVAMYAAKTERAGVRTYRAADGDSIARRLALAADLKVALHLGTLDLYFQPQAHPLTRSIVGFEALLRWNHPTFGFVPPPEIVAVAHRTGLIHDLTDLVLRRALEARARWLRQGRELAVSVNVTPADVADGGLTERVDELLAVTGTPADALILELTESDAMRDPDRSLSVLSALHDLGVRVSIDDFGTGYSSLAYLDRLPVHEVKIDRSFVMRLEHDANDSTIMRAAITLAHDLGLRVVAEGVEDDPSTALVAGMGCDLFQGYGLARPMPDDDVLAWLAAHERAIASSVPAA